MSDELKRSIILENYQNPINRGLKEDNTYIKVNSNNDSCIDEINLMVKIDNGIIVDAIFDGEACAICTSSTSIMISLILNKTVEQATKIYDNFIKMINEEEFDKEILEDAIVYEDIASQANRKKCALLPWMAFEKVVNEYRK